MRRDSQLNDDTRPILGKCEVCKCDIHGKNELYEQDLCYDFGYGLVCDRCMYEYVYDNFRLRE